MQHPLHTLLLASVGTQQRERSKQRHFVPEKYCCIVLRVQGSMKAGFGHSVLDVCRIDASAHACKRSKECEQVPCRLEGSTQPRRTSGSLRWCRHGIPVEYQESSRYHVPGIRNSVAAAYHPRPGSIASLVPSGPSCQAGQQLLPALGHPARVLLQQPGRNSQAAPHDLPQHHAAQQRFATPAAATPAAAALPWPSTPAAIVVYHLAHCGIHEAYPEFWHRAWAQNVMSARADNNFSRLSPAAVLQQAAASVSQRVLLFSFDTATCDPKYNIQVVLHGKDAVDRFREGQWDGGVKALAEFVRKDVTAPAPAGAPAGFTSRGSSFIASQLTSTAVRVRLQFGIRSTSPPGASGRAERLVAKAEQYLPPAHAGMLLLERLAAEMRTVPAAELCLLRAGMFLVHTYSGGLYGLQAPGEGSAAHQQLEAMLAQTTTQGASGEGGTVMIFEQPLMFWILNLLVRPTALCLWLLTTAVRLCIAVLKDCGMLLRKTSV